MAEAVQLYQVHKFLRNSDVEDVNLLVTGSTSAKLAGFLLQPSQSHSDTQPLTLPELSRLNRALNPPEIEFVNAILVQDTVQLLAFDQQINNVSAVLETLRRQKQQIQLQKNQHQQLLSPIWPLPFEMLGEVFRHCIPDENERGWRSQGYQRKAVMSLSHVCQRWRDAAIRTPHLWTTVDVGGPGKTSSSQVGGELSLAKLWLSRTGNLSISLKIHASMRPYRNSMHSLVQRYSDQLEYLELEGPHAVMSAGVRLNCPRLRTVVVSGTGRGRFGPGVSLRILDLAPELCTIKLALYLDPSRLFFPWYQLTELSLTHEDYSASECVALLRLASNVRNCELRLGPNNQDWSQSNIDVAHVPMLQSLVLTAESGCELLFASTSFPSLKELEIRIVDNGCWAPSELGDLLVRSACPLHRLTLVVWDDDNDLALEDNSNLAECLEKIPSLVELDLPTNNISATLNEELIGRLTRTSSNIDSSSLAFLPNLQILRFYSPGLSEVSGSELSYAMADMIKSRYEIGTIPHGFAESRLAQLRTVEIIGMDEGDRVENYINVEVMERLGMLADDGLDIYASNMNGDKFPLKSLLVYDEYVLHYFFITLLIVKFISGSMGRRTFE